MNTMHIWIGFVMGFVGSLHCLGMCGPIVLVLPRSAAPLTSLLGRLLYNLGRTVTYAFMGLIMGFIGELISLAGYQQALGIVVGSLMVLAGLFPGRIARLLTPGEGLGPWLGKLKSALGGLFQKGTLVSLFTIGLLNGFLPCGLVYAALGASLAAGGLVPGVLLMVMFGLGTIPALLALSYAGDLLTLGLRRRLQRLLPLALVIMGLLFILRGLALGIPYLSPPREKLMQHHHAVTMDRGKQPGGFQA